jgi:hypothetical protein
VTSCTAPSQVKWELYNKLRASNYKKVHYHVVSDVMVFQVNTRENTFVWVTRKQFNTFLLELLTIAATEQQAHLLSAAQAAVPLKVLIRTSIPIAFS